MTLLKRVVSVVVITIIFSQYSYQNQNEAIIYKNADLNRVGLTDNGCETPNGDRGECISINDCPSLKALIPVRSQRKFLQQSQCGWDNDRPMVCCKTERECFPDDLHWCEPNMSDECCIPMLNYNINIDASTIATQTERTGQCEESSLPPEPSSGCCGRDSSEFQLILPSDVKSLDQYPWTAIIEYSGQDTIQVKCGGSLISGRYVLSAAHCLFFEDWTPLNIRLGDFNIDHSGLDCLRTENGSDDCSGTAVIPIEKSIPHPEYSHDSRTQKNDIALIRMTENAPYTDFIKPICLPSTDITEAADISLRLYVAGWGLMRGSQTHSQLKQQAHIQFVTAENCLMAYRQLNIVLDEGQICAGGDMAKKSCKGDSGGALMVQNNERTEIVGVASFPCGRINRPAIYSKVHHYLPWIRSIVN